MSVPKLVKHIFITGANRGLGFHLLKKVLPVFKLENVFDTYRDPVKSKELQAFAAHHPNVQLIQLDVRDVKDTDADKYDEVSISPAVVNVSSILGSVHHNDSGGMYAHRRSKVGVTNGIRLTWMTLTNRQFSTGWQNHKKAEPALASTASSVDDDMKYIFTRIREELSGREPDLCEVASYYFDGQGKAIRPMLAILMARAVNAHLSEGESGSGGGSKLLPAQKQLALVSEMIHTATLVHDDVIDRSDKRRGKPSVNALFGQRKSIVGGDYVLAKAGAMIARLDNNAVTEIFAQVLEDLVHGEFMQMGANEEKTERFAHYIGKTFNKTASLMAYSCKGVAILGGADDNLVDKAFQYGKHLGIAFQLVDDLLDFVSSTDAMGKPVAADLQLGLATAPVLFAAQKFPELNPLIERRFSEAGDVVKALDCVHKSDGLEETKFLAQKYCVEAVRYANYFKPSPFQRELVSLTEKVLNRTK